MLHAIKLQRKLRGLVDFSQLRLGVTGFQLCVFHPTCITTVDGSLWSTLFLLLLYCGILWISLRDCDHLCCMSSVVFTLSLFASHQLVAMLGTRSCVTLVSSTVLWILHNQRLSFLSPRLLIPRCVSLFDWINPAWFTLKKVNCFSAMPFSQPLLAGYGFDSFIFKYLGSSKCV